MPTKDHIIISNGEKVYVNDHVYVSPAWELRDGIPYSIARIMEFLPPEGETRQPEQSKGKGKEKEAITRVRLAWYYRPSDLSDRQVADSRLLLAAIFSEVHPITFLRAKCFVKHKEKISDLTAWKKKPDRFYFTKLFDPYIKKEYEVVRSMDVRNLPTDIRSTLQSRYEFVITEREVVSDLTDDFRECETCHDWCPAPESVQCDNCKNFFHMRCVNPPLSAKPAKGYGWTCAPCTAHHEDRVDRGKLPRSTTPMKGKGGSNDKGKGKQAAPPAPRFNTDDKYFKMWPYRYFGLYTVAEDTLDPDDMIFPRAATRVGPKYQSTLPEFIGTPPPITSNNDPIPMRGGEDTIEVMCELVDLTPEELVKVEELKAKLFTKPEQFSSIDYVEEAMRRISGARASGDYDNIRLKGFNRPRKWQRGETRFIDREWTDEEKEQFEKGLEIHGAEPRLIKDDIKGRTTAEVVRYYGIWKAARLGEENRKNKNLPLSAQPALTKFRRTVTVRSENDDEGSVLNGEIENDPVLKQSLMCGSCRTKDSTVWWRAPRGLLSSVMCDTCGIVWRKYGDIKGPPKQDEPPPKKPVNAEKREGTPLPTPAAKRQKPLPAPNKYGACACCRKVGLAGTVVKCDSCSLVVHASCYGVPKAEAAVEPWFCEFCANEKHQEFSLASDCLLCPRSALVPTPPPAKGSSGEFLRAWKPTEGRGWVHAICSVFVPEVIFTDAQRLRMVEGMSSLPSWRWTEPCSFCKQTGGGAVVKCPDCPMKFHLSCAWRNQLRFGFELTPRLPGSQHEDDPPYVTFRGVQGILDPYVWCNAHILERDRIVWGPCDASEGRTALQIYCQTYKQVPLEHSYGLLRRAYRLDMAQELNTPPSLEGPPPDHQCDECGSRYSPYFWPHQDQPRSQTTPSSNLLCHRCKIEERGSRVMAEAMDIDADILGRPNGRLEVNGHSRPEDAINGVANGIKPEPVVNGVNIVKPPSAIPKSKPILDLPPNIKRLLENGPAQF